MLACWGLIEVDWYGFRAWDLGYAGSETTVQEGVVVEVKLESLPLSCRFGGMGISRSQGSLFAGPYN